MDDAHDAHDVLAALRLGWAVAEMRGRNRPGGPSGEVIGMPDHVDYPLPLRIERGRTELRVEIQSVVAELAQELRVDTAPGGTSFSAVLGDKAKLLARVRAPKAADALRRALGISLAGLTGTLKNSAQAMLKRLRQDAYTDLVAVAVQTAPKPPDKSALQKAINRRGLTPATPN